MQIRKKSVKVSKNMTAKFVYVKGDKKTIKSLAKKMSPALSSLADK